jgi:hypothetical protein
MKPARPMPEMIERLNSMNVSPRYVFSAIIVTTVCNHIKNAVIPGIGNLMR